MVVIFIRRVGRRAAVVDGREQRCDANGHPAAGKHADARSSHFVFQEDAYRTHFGGAEGDDAFPRELLLVGSGAMR